jgi:hypothetical protein
MARNAKPPYPNGILGMESGIQVEQVPYQLAVARFLGEEYVESKGWDMVS